MADTNDENRQAQEEECLALEAIFGEEAFKKSGASPDAYIYTLNLDEDQPDLKSPRSLVLHFFLPPTYPSHDMPIYEVTSVYCGGRKVDEAMLNAIQSSFCDLFQPNQVVLYEWIDWLRGYLEEEVTPARDVIADITHSMDKQTLDENDAVVEDTDNEPPAVTPASDDKSLPTIYSSESMIDRKSVFVAHVATVHSAAQVKAVIAKLMENKKIARATHNIMAYRIALPDGGMLQDNDDDGETAAGGRLMHLMQILDVENVVVVVSRWFGGIMLGADRFKDINNCARKALEDCGYIKEDHKSTVKAKRKK
ncbi:hypothetical protein DFQ28_005676 [Apophysomyces sp. BC1034]|nr:hypothetical protein DFQ30_006293 [Apophysomyces sp. BC1015]KAG0177046.1 hypothetical protein DFQ29_005329 [Apophysomyces sp. BC1021]KAG0187904.1 hypothetical protein DFQ28_005676 [Apophysomyces sp. BC1034]